MRYVTTARPAAGVRRPGALHIAVVAYGSTASGPFTVLSFAIPHAAT